jgi:hypothetical protein
MGGAGVVRRFPCPPRATVAKYQGRDRSPASGAERSHGKVKLESSGDGQPTFRLWFPPVHIPGRDRSVIVLA